VPGASVVLINPKTGERKETWTDEAGNYAFTGVPDGTYKLEVSLVGFRPDVREPIPVNAGKALKVNLALVMAVGQEQENLAGVPEHRDNRGGTVPNLSQLPREVRQRAQAYQQLGATGGSGAAGAANGEAGSLRFSEAAASAGSQSEESAPSEADSAASAANSFLLSGSVTPAATPEPDERQIRERIQEFRMANQGPPGFGGGPGGFGGGPMFMFFGGPGRRRGVNRLRGNVVETYSNSALDARPYPLNAPETRQISFHHEDLGMTLGGPLSIPRIYSGKDKTSFFVHYHLTRDKSPFDAFATVPTMAERAGDFSQAVIPTGPLAGTVPVIYDPLTNTPFAGNVIPSNRLNPAAVGLLQYIPLPNLPGSVQNFHLQEALPSATDRVMGRIGHQMNNKDNVNAFYAFNSSRSTGVGNFPALTHTTHVRGQSLNLGETHTFGPGTVNTFAFNFSRQRSSTLNPFAFQQNIAAELGIQGVSEDPRDWGIPLINFTNFQGLNDTIPVLTRNQTFRVSDFLLLNRGQHNVRAGGELRRVNLATLTNPDARGTFTFTGFSTSEFVNGTPVANTGFDFADFLLGLPQTTSERFGVASNYLRSWVYAGFLQDDWRLSSRFTVNAGLRYEYFTPFTEKYGHLSDLEIGPGYTSVGVVTGQSPGLLPPSLLRADGNNFAPRIGLAFRPSTNHTLVFRAGYGIFYDGSIYQRLAPNNLVDQPPFATAATLITSPERVLTLQNGFPTVGENVSHNTYAVDPNFRTPYGQTWNFTIEQEVARNVILSLGYVGTKGSKLDLLLAPRVAQNGGHLQALPFIYETSGASSIYHGLQVGLRRQFHGGFSIYGHYTYSKSIDDAASVGGAGNIVAQDYLNLAAERGLSTFDMRHKLLVNYEYQFPFGERRRWLTHGGLAGHLLGDWEFSGVTTIQSGTPYTARVLGNYSNIAGAGPFFAERADATGEPVSLPGFERSTLRFFNTGAFSLPLPGHFGNAGRNTIPGPGLVNFNMSLDRLVTISRERGVNADFRIAANNVFNTPQFNGLATVINATNFGRITSVGTMRTLTASVRLRF
jgi:hypothetical protein